jgi:hypothetical protein
MQEREMGTHRANSERAARVQARYDALMNDGKHGHYETMFKVVREEIEAEREACAHIALAIDSKRGNEKEIARAIRNRSNG